jgi:hypothetical protein
MTEIGIVRQVHGEWNRSTRLVRLRIEADKLDQPQDVLIAPQDMRSLVSLLLSLSGKAGPGPAAPSEDRMVRPIGVDCVALGATDDGDTVLEVVVGRTALAFFLPLGACRQLGEALLTVTATRSRAAN